MQDITTTDVVALLKPLWGERQESAEKLREAIERVLDAAKAEGHRRGENPARRKGHLALLMHKPNTLTTGSHHAAMPYGEVPALMSRLQKEKGVNFRALELTILTAVRSGEAN
ncbi:hypothetical protein LJR098_001991 [Rhizobium sp. LjRoot98]|uniref:phage integrase central domain-containing protein n=1 Tax=Rhizobium sp. Root1204 TaxID=1736428 RepID=UPI0012E3E491|nr:hypothetical protein [Rhizobium sp. Root1204]